MLLTLLKALDTTDLMEVVTYLTALAPLDIDLILYTAKDNGEVEIDKKNNTIKPLVEPEKVYYEPLLASKLVAIVKEYDKQEANITRNRLEKDVFGNELKHIFDPRFGLKNEYGYTFHDLACTLYALEQGFIHGYPKLCRYEISVPEIKGQRPYNKFVFYTFLDHQEYGAKAVNDYIDQWQKANLPQDKKSKKKRK